MPHKPKPKIFEVVIDEQTRETEVVKQYSSMYHRGSRARKGTERGERKDYPCATKLTEAY